MATIRAYTTIEQSRKLAEILPIESADMHWTKDFDGSWFVDLAEYTLVKIPKYVGNIEEHLLPCWSLASLLDVLPVTATLLKDGNISNIGDAKYSCECSMVNIHKWFDNPIDACIELILKLHEREML